MLGDNADLNCIELSIGQLERVGGGGVSRRFVRQQVMFVSCLWSHALEMGILTKTDQLNKQLWDTECWVRVHLTCRLI